VILKKQDDCSRKTFIVAIFIYFNINVGISNCQTSSIFNRIKTMLYSFLIYEIPGVFQSYSDEEQEQVLGLHRKLQAIAQEKGPLAVAQLMPTSSAITVRSEPDSTPIILDGPFAETKELFMGIYTFECETLDEAVEHAKQLANPCHSIEIRPVQWSGGVLANLI